MNKKGDLDIITLKTKYSTMELTTFGAHVLSFVPNGHSDVLWMGSHNTFTKEKAIRGGIPVCWPKFGDEALHVSFPKHGFARLQEWQVDEINEGEEESSIILSLKQNSHWSSICHISASAKLTITINKNLNMVLETTNHGSSLFTYSEALHTYFSIADINSVSISGLSGSSYYDRLDGDSLKKVDGNFTFSKMEDTVFANSVATICIEDNKMSRLITIKKNGSKSTVVWNPYQKNVLDEVVNDDYKGFVCVEAGNVRDDAITLKPNESHTLSMQISIELIKN